MSSDPVKNDCLYIPLAIALLISTSPGFQPSWPDDITTLTYLFLDLFLYATEKVGARQAENGDQ